MTRHDTAILAVRLGALYGWFQAIDYVANGIIMFFFAQSKLPGGVSPFEVFIYALPCTALFAAGLFLWLRAPSLARHFVSAQPEVITSSDSSAVPLAFAVVGLAVFLYALPRVINECVTLLRSEHFVGRDASREFLQHLPSLGATAIQLICGFVLFVRSHRLARWWERKREVNASV